MRTKTMQIMTAATIGIAAPGSAIAAGGEHPHHIGVTTGLASHGDENSAFLGLDYVYRFENDFAAGVFLERVSGDFDLLAYGLTFGKYFENGFKLAAGPGVEKKLKDNKNLLLFHFTAGYDWHAGQWSYGPVATIDFIEDSSNTFYLGFAIGYGF